MEMKKVNILLQFYLPSLSNTGSCSLSNSDWYETYQLSLTDFKERYIYILQPLNELVRLEFITVTISPVVLFFHFAVSKKVP